MRTPIIEMTAERAEARIAALEAALQPFAQEACRFDRAPLDGPEYPLPDSTDLATAMQGWDECGMTLGDLRQARGALGGGTRLWCCSCKRHQIEDSPAVRARLRSGWRRGKDGWRCRWCRAGV